MNGSDSGGPAGWVQMNRPRAKRGVGLIFWVLVATSCAGQEGEATNGREVAEEVSAEVEQFLSEQVPGGSFSDRGQAVVAGESTVTITLEEFSFQPTILIGGAGQELEVVLANAGVGPHTFTVDDQGVHVALRRAQNGQATVTIPSSDAPILFYCRFHRDQGMVGALTQAPPT
jgi:plastocyanin